MRIIKYFVLVVSVQLLLVSCTDHQPYDPQPYQVGAAAYERGDYEAALASWRPLAEEGDVLAQHGLGSLYFAGTGVEQNNSEAARLFQLAADQGLAEAQLNLGTLYALGRGVPPSYVEAERLFSLAIAQGLERAQFSLDTLHETIGTTAEEFAFASGALAHGRGDYSVALEIWLPIAEQGHSGAQYVIGTMYTDGTAFPLDFVEAYRWMILASLGDDDDDAQRLAAEAMAGLATRMTDDEIVRARALAGQQ